MSKIDSMEKAYDVSVLEAELKDSGIAGGIDVLKGGVNTLQAWLEKSAALSTDGLIGKLDDIAVKGEKFATDFVIAKLDELKAKLLADAPAPAPVAAEPAPAAVPAPAPVEGDVKS